MQETCASFLRKFLDCVSPPLANKLAVQFVSRKRVQFSLFLSLGTRLCASSDVLLNFVGMKINVLKGDRFEVNPEEINVTFDDVKGVSTQ